MGEIKDLNELRTDAKGAPKSRTTKNAILFTRNIIRKFFPKKEGKKVTLADWEFEVRDKRNALHPLRETLRSEGLAYKIIDLPELEGTYVEPEDKTKRAVQTRKNQMDDFVH